MKEGIKQNIRKTLKEKPELALVILKIIAKNRNPTIRERFIQSMREIKTVKPEIALHILENEGEYLLPIVEDCLKLVGENYPKELLPILKKMSKTQNGINANFYILGEKPEDVMSGFIRIEEKLDNFINSMKESMEHVLNIKVESMKDYRIYYVDFKDKPKLIEIKDQMSFDNVIKLEKIFIMILHKNLIVKMIETHPRFFNWIKDPEGEFLS